MAMAIIGLITLSLIFTALVWWLHRYFAGHPPLLVVLFELIGIPMVFGMVAIPLALRLSTGFDAIFWVIVTLGISGPPIYAIALSVPSTFADYFTVFLFDPREADPDGFLFARAKARAVQNDITGALREYRLYFEQNPRRPAPLFAGAAYAERKGEFLAAAGFYREIMIKFEKKRPIWAEAALRQAALFKDKLHDNAACKRQLEEIVARAPRLEAGKKAAVLLSRC